jgi:MFS transporter, DHA1 family, tetracycline resistance protein
MGRRVTEPGSAGKRSGKAVPRDFRTRLAILFLTVFVDLVGFGIILPLLPLYADRFGASGTMIGVLVLSYSAAQLFMAPVWGKLSDRFGRRPILIIGLIGSAISYLVFAFAGSILALLLSRVMAGVGGANVPVAQAYIADITPPERRAGGMGLIGAAFGLGFIFGPAIGGILAPISPAAPGLAAAALCAVNALLAIFLLPESLSREEREARRAAAGAGEPRTGQAPLPASGMGPLPVPAASLRAAVRSPDFATILILTFLFTAAFSTMHPVFPLFAAQRFGMEERAVGWLFAFLGTVSALMQGVVVRLVAPRIGEDRLVRLAALPFVAGLLLVAVSQTVPVLLLALGLLAIGFGGTLPSLVSLLSRAAPDELQGSSLGIGQSVGALARIAGPLAGGIAWDLFGAPAPFLLGALLAAMAAARVLLRTVPGRVRPSVSSTPDASRSPNARRT